MARSPNPDLLFDDCMLRRVRRIAGTYGPSITNAPLDRVTLFVTHRCNLRCRYCNGPHLNPTLDPAQRRRMLSGDLTLPQYRALIADWAGHGLAHIHFTGGEPTLNPHLPAFVRLATERGILSSLTTNGTADASVYRQLVEAGLTEIRVSLDSEEESQADLLTGVPGAWRTVTANLEAFRALKEEGRELFVILNACVTSCTVDDVASTVEGLATYRPDDLKLLMVAEDREAIRTHGRRRLVNDLLACARESAPQYELLPRKIRGLFRRDSTGFLDPLSQRLMRRCYIPLTERTLDANSIYPCSIYLRYQGRPLAAATASFDAQQQAIARFVDEHDCRDDPICRQNCTSCCKEFNLRTNQAIRRRNADEAGRRQGVIDIPPASDETVAAARNRYARILALPAPPPHPGHLIVKPYGMPFLDEIRRYAVAQGLTIRGEASVPDWGDLALMLYFRNATRETARLSVAKNAAFRRAEPPGPARLLVLGAPVPDGKLRRIKRELRSMFGEPVTYCRCRGVVKRIRINCVHSCDIADREREAKILAYFRIGRCEG